jgi:integrase
VAEWFRGQWSGCAPATWNARPAALRSAGPYWIEQGWIHANPAVRLKDESVGEDLDRALSEEDVDTLIADTVQPLRDRALWSLLYESAARSEEVCSPATSRVLRFKATLHQLRHSGLTHASEDGTGAPMLMTYSGHRSIRSLAKHARLSTDALGKWQAKRDPNRRGL